MNTTNDVERHEAGKYYEKGTATYHDDVSKVSSNDDDSVLAGYDEKMQSKIVHRIDRRLIPICGIMYCVSLLDRTNLSNAAIAGMNVELLLTKVNGVDRYSVVTLVFFLTYVLCQPAGTILCRFIGPRTFLSSITLAWGIVMIGFGFVQGWEALVGLRLLLGILEAGFFPGVVYLLSTWYKRYEVGKRYSVFYCIGCVASAFGGILAFGLMQMEGVAGYGGWRWIFIIEGILTCLIAGAGAIFLLSFPDQSSSKSLSFLSPEELQVVLARVNKDRGDAIVEPFAMKKFLRPAGDARIWAYAFIFGATTTVSYAIAYFLPIILNEGLGFTTGQSQCLVAPPYAFAGIVMFTTGWLGDNYHQRGIIVAFNATLCLLGLSLLGFSTNDKARYLGVFFATAGANANVPATMAYQANNIRGQWKRAFCSATLVGFGGIGGIVGSTVFRSVDKPSYVPGVSTAMGAQVLILVVVVLLTVSFRISNGKAEKTGKILENGDSTFRYTY